MTDASSSSPPSALPPVRRRRRLVAACSPLLAIAIYATLFALVPGFSDQTMEALHAVGFPRPRHDPGRRDLVMTANGRFLWGGPDEKDHFDINVFRLDPERLHYGLGRERFPAVITPRFVAVSEIGQNGSLVLPSFSGDGEATRGEAAASARWPGDAARVLVVRIEDDTRVYPLQLLRRHEVVNDEVGGRPIFVAYCYLADLAAAFDRRLGEHTLTFAVSGYTYYDPDVWEGRDAFVLWDRDTESLWWPPLGRAVSGPLIDAPLRVLETSAWSQTTWGEAKRRFPAARVLEAHQSFEPPADWPRLDLRWPTGATTRPEAAGAPTVPPAWGVNADLDS